MDIMLAKREGKLIAAYDSDFEKLQKLPEGETVLCKVSRPRNLRFHRKYFALLNMVFQNQDIYNNIDHMRRDLTVKAGFYTVRYNFYGEEIREPDSICFAKMDETTFNDLYNKTIDAIIDWFKFDRQDIIDNVESFF